MNIYIAFGSNKALGSLDPQNVVAAALKAMAEYDIEVMAVSRFWRSPAWPDPSDPPFVNGVARIATPLTAPALMAQLHALEARFDRVRTVRNAPRTLDLDIIDFNGQISGPDGMPILPHPRAVSRAFVLLPLRDVARDWSDPVSGQGIDVLIAALPAGDVASTLPIT